MSFTKWFQFYRYQNRMKWKLHKLRTKQLINLTINQINYSVKFSELTQVNIFKFSELFQFNIYKFFEFIQFYKLSELTSFINSRNFILSYVLRTFFSYKLSELISFDLLKLTLISAGMSHPLPFKVFSKGYRCRPFVNLQHSVSKIY